MMLRRALFASLVACATLAATPAPGDAQELQRIAAVVNDEVVSVFDLAQRMKLVIMATGLEGTPEVRRQIGPQVLRTLIDERLRLQEAARMNVSVSDGELRNAMGSIEERNKIGAEGLEAFLRSLRIDPETMRLQLRAQIAWSKLVRQRGRRTVSISDDEIDERLGRLKASQGLPEYLLSEIFLVVESTSQDAQVQENADRLVAQIRSGTPFSALAEQFSEGTTARQGGTIGWMLEDQLTDEVAAALARLEPGQVSDPVRSSGGYMIVQLRDKRQRMAPDVGDTVLALKQVLLPAATSAAAAKAVGGAIAGCDDMDRAAAEAKAGASGDLGRLRLKDLPQRLRDAVTALPVGTVSAPVATAQGVHLLMVCDRVEPPSNLPGRDEIRAGILDKRYELLSRRYLRDLRRSAFVDIRI